MPNYFSHQSGRTEPISVTHNPLNDPSALQTDQNAPMSSKRDHNPEPGPSGLQSVSIELQTPPRMNVNTDTDTEYSPRKMLIKEITKVLSPEETEDIQKANCRKTLSISAEDQATNCFFNLCTPFKLVIVAGPTFF